MDFDIHYTWQALPRLLDGAVVTASLALAAMALSVVVGTALTILRASGGKVLPRAVAGYVSFVRGTPLLIQILLVFYVFPAFGVDFGPFTSAIIALGLGSAAFTSEILRGGLTAISTGQIEAARALALPRRALWLKILLPQLFKLALPPLMSEFTFVVKGTALVSVITVLELMRIAQQIYNANYRPAEVLLGVALIYFAMIFPISRLSQYLEQRQR